MIKNKDFIILGLQSLDTPIGSNCVNLAYEIAKNNRVLYVNYPMNRSTLMRDRKDPMVINRKQVISGELPELKEVQKNMWSLSPRTVLEPISQIGSKSIFKFLNKINNKRYAKRVKWAIQELGFEDYIIFNDSDFHRAFYFKEYLNPKVSVYYTRDNMRETKFFQKQGAYLEDQMMAKSDLVVSNSVYLNQIAEKANPNSYYVGQGCDISIFDNDLIKELPEEFNDIKKPIIGYIGALLSSRLDMEILEYIAQSKPEWSLVLVGPEDDRFRASNLHNLKNVYFLGSKPMEMLPNYLKAFDVALNPQALNPLTIGNYPRKIDEYLAMGKPTVATKTETMGVFKNYVYLAMNKEEYIILIDKALKEHNPELEKGRIEFAGNHTWENNVKEIYNAINKVCKV